MATYRRRVKATFDEEQGVFMISVAAELAEMHTQTLRVGAQTGGPVAVAIGDRTVGASPFGGARAAADDLTRAATRAKTAEKVEVSIGGRRYYVAAVPVPSYTGKDGLRYLVFRSLDEAL